MSEDPFMSEPLAAEIRDALARTERGEVVDLGSFAQYADDEQAEAAGELTALTEDLGLYDQPPVACMSHLRMVPCRKEGPHVLSSDPGDVARAAAFAGRREAR